MNAAVLPYEAMYPLRLPWRQMFDDMKERGVAYSKQAALLGLEWSTFQRWMNEGAEEPRYSYGRAIIAMHSAVCGEALTLQRQREGRVSL